MVVVDTNPPATFSSENPAVLTITYDQSVAPADESTIQVNRFDGTPWAPVGEPCTGGVPGVPLAPDPCISARDTGANTITIKTTAFSDWALMGSPAPSDTPTPTMPYVPGPPAAPTPTPVAPTETPTPTPAPTPTTTPAGPSEHVGDVNCSGAVISTDAVLVLQLDAGLIDSLSCQENADVNRDGAINSIDAALILQLDAGLIDSLPLAAVGGRGWTATVR